MNPIFEHKGGPIFEGWVDFEPGWYFWNETWTDVEGPYGSEADCIKALSDYARNL